MGLAADALLHPVLVPVEDVAAVEALGLVGLLVVADLGVGSAAPPPGGAAPGVLPSHLLAAEQPVLADRDAEPLEVAHQYTAPSRARLRVLTRMAALNSK